MWFMDTENAERKANLVTWMRRNLLINAAIAFFSLYLGIEEIKGSINTPS